jgi:predicted DNA-binding transcriptional regulator YafY
MRKEIESACTPRPNGVRRADRLFSIVQLLRGGRHVTARSLAARLEVSERTIYRDIDELTLCGVPVEGAAGQGYRLPSSFEIPPLMFERREIEALVVGARFVEAWCGPELATSARSALDRIRGVVPATLLAQLDEAPIYALRFGRGDTENHFDLMHRAVRERRRVVMDYAGQQSEAPSTRTIRPLSLYFWGKVWTLAAWCELREDFRSFRIDRITAPRLGEPFPEDADKALERYLSRVRDQARG